MARSVVESKQARDIKPDRPAKVSAKILQNRAATDAAARGAARKLGFLDKSRFTRSLARRAATEFFDRGRTASILSGSRIPEQPKGRVPSCVRSSPPVSSWSVPCSSVDAAANGTAAGLARARDRDATRPSSSRQVKAARRRCLSTGREISREARVAAAIASHGSSRRPRQVDPPSQSPRQRAVGFAFSWLVLAKRLSFNEATKQHSHLCFRFVLFGLVERPGFATRVPGRF